MTTQFTSKIKDSWYQNSPSKLYDLCVDKIIKNIDLLLVKNETKCNRKQFNSNLKKKDSRISAGNQQEKHAPNETKNLVLKGKRSPHQKEENLN